MKPRSLRWRLVLLAAATILMTLSVAGVSLVLIFERHLERRVEQELETRLTELLAAFALQADEPVLKTALSDPRYDQPLSGAYWQVSDEHGPVRQSRSLWDQSLALQPAASASAAAYEIAWPNDATLYVKDQRVLLGNGGSPRIFRLAVALDHAEIATLRQSFTSDVAQALGIIGAVLLLGSFLQIQLGLRPLAHLRSRLAAMHAGRTTRLEGAFPAEVAPLAEDFNALLARQQEMLRKARERAGALAHGLKTPLTILAGEARRLDERGIACSAEALREQLGIMRTHVERELARARSHGSLTPSGLHTDAHHSASRLIDLVRRMPRGRDMQFENALPVRSSVPVDPDDFGEILGNLIDNGRKYARARVRISAGHIGGRAHIFVDDDGPGIAAQLREKMTLRGERAHGGTDGSGLGLAIVSDLLADYGLTLILSESPLGGCRAGFAVPGTPATAHAQPAPMQPTARPQLA